MERHFTDAGDGVGDGDAPQAATIIKCIIINTNHAFGYRIIRYFIVISINHDNRFPYIRFDQACNTTKCWKIRSRNLYAHHTTTARERGITDAGDGVGDGDARQAGTTLERRTTYDCNGVTDGDACQAATARERGITDASHRVGDGDARQTATVTERIITDAGHGVADGDACQAATTLERRTSDAGHGVGNGDARQTGTVTERIITDAGHRVANGDVCQDVTTIERHFPNASHRVTDGDARQATTIYERFIPDAGHRVGNGDARQASTIRERHFPDAGHGVTDSDTSQAATIKERITIDAGHVVGCTVVSYSFGYNYVTGIGRAVTRTFRIKACYSSLCSRKVVINAIHVCIVGKYNNTTHAHEQGKKNCESSTFHITNLITGSDCSIETTTSSMIHYNIHSFTFRKSDWNRDRDHNQLLFLKLLNLFYT